MSYLYLTYLKLILHRKRFYLCNLIFPITFAILLFYVVGNMNVLGVNQPICVAIVSEQKNDIANELEHYMKMARNSENELLFDVSHVDLIEAKKIMAEEQIIAYIEISDEIKLTIDHNGTRENIVQSYVDHYRQILDIYGEATESKKGLREEYLSLLGLNQNVIEHTQFEIDSSWMYFYTLIGMSCFLCVNFGLFLAQIVFMNQSALAARLSCSPVGRGTRFFSGFLASSTAAFVSIAIILCFVHYVLAMPLETTNLGFWIIVVVGVLLSILIGYIFGGIFHQKNTWKESIAIAVVILCSFFAGIVRIDIKYMMQQQFGPFVYCNPVHVISNGLYCLFYQENFRGYAIDIVILGAALIIHSIIAIILTGRRAYDHI